jgi:hypothetical protein
MRSTAILAAGALIVASAAAAIAKPADPETELAKALEGRVAGTPVNCIAADLIRSARIIDKTAIIWGAGNTIYVNRPGGARTLDNWDILVTEPFGAHLCRIEQVRLIDRSTRMTTGFVSLNEFVPYKKVKTAQID